MKQLKLLALLSILPLMSCQTEKPAESVSPLHARLDSVGNALLEMDGVLGFSVAIMEGTDTAYHRGFGFQDLAKQQPVTTDTRFLMASISKLMGATVVMKLAEEGKLSLDQTLTELLPEFPNPDQGQRITLRHLLSHTSGLEDYAVVFDSIFVRTGIDPTLDDYYAFFKDRPLNFEPGTNYSYCNSGFLLMSLVIERATGNTLQEEFDRVINRPGGLDLKLIAEAVDYPEMSDYWESKGISYIPKPHWTWIQGDGGLTATPVMLAHFPHMWADGRIISKQSFEEMSAPATLENGIQSGYGLGVRIGEFYGERIIGHTGGNKSTYSIMVYFPDRDLTIVAMMNTDASRTDIRMIFRNMAQHYFGYPDPDFSDQEASVEDLSAYAGHYSAYFSGVEYSIEVSLKEDGQLHYCEGEYCQPMTYLGDHKFWISAWPYDLVQFETDSTDKISAVKEYYTGFYSVLRMKSTPTSRHP